MLPFAHIKGSNVVIEVEDDGGGIDTESVLSKAIKEELLTRNRLQPFPRRK